jgi:hypothetical protein
MLSAKRCDGLRRNLINKEIQGRGRKLRDKARDLVSDF